MGRGPWRRVHCRNMEDPRNAPEAYWKQRLTPEQYRVLREKGTEPPFSGELLENKETGMYVCAACGQSLFSSDDKFESGSGWPSFTRPAQDAGVEIHDDRSLGMQRTEALCGRCGGHLGHVFDDGPRTLPDGRQATGKRYCINSLALGFQEGPDTKVKTSL